MSTTTFTPGHHIIWHDEAYLVHHHLANGALVLQHVTSQALSTHTRATLTDDLFAGHLLARGMTVPPSHAHPSTRGFDDYPPTWIALAKTRLAVIQPLLTQSWHYDRALAQLHEWQARLVADPSLPIRHLSLATMRRWYTTYLAAGEDLRALIPQFAARGKAGVARLDDPVEAIIATAITTLYLRREKATAIDVWHEVMAAIQDYNQQPEHQHRPLVPPARRTVERRIAALDPHLVQRKKQGAWAAGRAARQHGRQPTPDMILMRAVIDHLFIDLIAVDGEDRKPLGTLTLCYCLDEASRYPLGYYLTFDPPNYVSVMECLYRSILPKTLPPGIEHPWLAYGIPAELACDNGPGFEGKQLANACAEVGIHLDPGPVRTPEFKAKIERSFRRVNERLIHQLPGTLFTNAQQRGDYASMRNACLALDEVDLLLTRYFIDIYAQEFHRGLRAIPAKRWAALAGSDFTPRLPMSASALAIALGWTEYRRIFAYGLSLYNLQYNDERLSTLRERLGRRKVKVKVHPGNLGSIAVYDPFAEEYIAPVHAVDRAYAEGLSLWQHRVLCGYAREEAGQVDTAALGQAERRQREVVQKARDRKAQATRTVVARSQGGEASYAAQFPEPTPSLAVVSPAELPAPPKWSHESLLDVEP